MALKLSQVAEFLASLPYRTAAQLLVAYGVGGEFDYSLLLLEMESAYEKPKAKLTAARRAIKKVWAPEFACDFATLCAGEAQLDIVEASQIVFALLADWPLPEMVPAAKESPFEERRGVLTLPAEVQSQTEALCALFLQSLAVPYRERVRADCELFIRPAPEGATQFEVLYATLSVALSLYWQGYIGADLAVEFFNSQIPSPEPKELYISFAGEGLARLIAPPPAPPFTPLVFPSKKAKARLEKLSKLACDSQSLRWHRGLREN